MRRLTAVPLSLVLALMMGCAAIGIGTETFNGRLLAGYSAVTAVRTTNINLLDLDVITADDGANVAKAADVARAGLDVARQLSRTDMTAAEAKVSAVRTALNALTAYLATRSK